MKLFTKIASLVVALSVVLCMNMTVSASANDDVINALKAAKVPSIFLIKAENYLNSASTTPLTDAQATAVKSEIAKVQNVMTAANVTDLSKLSQADKNTVIAAITAAGKDVDLNVSIKKQADGNFLVAVTDKNGKDVVEPFTSNQVKQTGVDNTLMVLGFALIVLSAGSLFVAKKARA